MVIIVLDSLLALIVFLLITVPAFRNWVILIFCFLAVIAAGVHVYQQSAPMFWILLVLFLLFCWALMSGPLMDENSPESIAMRKYKGKSFREIFAEKYREALQEQAEKQREQQEAQQQAQPQDQQQEPQNDQDEL